jgi:YD repeat-containing protein
LVQQAFIASNTNTSTVNYAYDSGIPNAHGRLVSVSSTAATDAVSVYEELGRITGSSQTIGGGSALPFSYSYNLADALVQTTYPTGRVLTNSYDAANRITG